MASVSSALTNRISMSTPTDSGMPNFPQSRCLLPSVSQKKNIKLRLPLNNKKSFRVHAEYNGRGQGSNGTDFLTGFLVGGVVFGALGYLFAPQISRALSGDEDRSRKRIPKIRMDDDEGLEKTRKTLNEKIAQLNAAIDDVSAQLRAEDGVNEPALATSNTESEPMGN
eukprot:TRINITY_DN4835_c0_g1_i1.p1 TRINITY_DN4835_c0_g1~~TRINITY_DN4835_c0_g1_i1.p1  ORF type:complete len:168 (-),score=45.79 TRINITY_DN4835_c0_g1_i1:181-684(-)